jgi:RimJ/RimL family protein N-acetyltransferase
MVLDLTPNAPIKGAITAERFVLRPARPSDVGLIAHHMGDARVALGTPSIPHPLPPGAAQAFVARAMAGKPGEAIWIMDGSASGLAEVLGVISLVRMDDDVAQGGQSEISFWVAPAYWKSGIASQAVAALMAANPQNCRTLFAEVFQDNTASARVLTNSGFAYLGDAETFSVARGARVATWTYVKTLAG